MIIMMINMIIRICLPRNKKGKVKKIEEKNRTKKKKPKKRNRIEKKKDKKLNRKERK